MATMALIAALCFSILARKNSAISRQLTERLAMDSRSVRRESLVSNMLKE
jgi:hypothetical protein